MFVLFVDLLVFVTGSQGNVGKSVKSAAQLVIVRNVGLFAYLVPEPYIFELPLAGDHDRKLFEKLLVEFLGIRRWILIDPFVLTSGIHPLQSLKHCFTSFLADLILRNEKIGLKVFRNDEGIVINRDVDSCEDKVFRKFCIDSVGRGDEYSKGEEPE